MSQLIDAAGNIVPTALCFCGRPKLASSGRCCSECNGDFAGPYSRHATGCNIRCVGMGVPGFGVRVSYPPRHEQRFFVVALPEPTHEEDLEARNEAIRAAVSSGESQANVARRYGLTAPRVWQIVNRYNEARR